MRHSSSAAVLFVSTAIILICSQGLLASETGQSASLVAAPTVDKAVQANLASLVDVQKYNRSIHIMAMLLVGFGFLMVFVKKYGRSAVTATYLLVSVAIPVYFSVKSYAIFGEASNADIDKFILAEFAAASLLICAGAVLGRLKMFQYMVLGVIFTLVYMLNEWVVVGGGFDLVKSRLRGYGRLDCDTRLRCVVRSWRYQNNDDQQRVYPADRNRRQQRPFFHAGQYGLMDILAELLLGAGCSGIAASHNCQRGAGPVRRYGCDVFCFNYFA